MSEVSGGGGVERSRVRQADRKEKEKRLQGSPRRAREVDTMMDGRRGNV